MQFNTVFEDMTVNAYLVWDPATRDAAVFDTGTDVSGMLDTIAAKRLTLRAIFVTHTHGDHIFDLDRLREKTGAPSLDRREGTRRRRDEGLRRARRGSSAG